MITKPFYRYRDGNKLIDSPDKPVGFEYENMTQLIADSGKDLTDGTIRMGVVITTDASKWTEVDAPIDTDPEAVIAEMEGLYAQY